MDASGSPGYGIWHTSSVSGQGGYTLRCGTSSYNIIDITGGTSKAPDNPTLFLNNNLDSTLDGQSDWWMPGASEADLQNLPNTDNGFWTPIINSAWNLALTAPDEGSVQAEAVVLSAEPSSYNSNQYWFLASVTRAEVTSITTVTQVTTSTGDPVTQTFNADGPTSTITSTVINTMTMTTQVTSNAPQRRSLAPRFDFTTPTSWITSIYWLTSSVGGPVVQVTSTGGYVYTTEYVTTGFYVTVTSTDVIHAAPTTAAGTFATTLPQKTVTSTPPAKTETQPPSSNTQSQAGSGDTTNSIPTPSSSPGSTSQPTSSASGSAGGDNSGKYADKTGSSTPVAAIVGGTLGGVIIIILLLTCWWYRRHRRNMSPPLDEVDDMPPGYSRRSELPPHASSMAYSPVAQVKPELAAQQMVTRVPQPETVAVERPNTPRHEMDNGIDANMNSGPLYEMPAHGNWQ